MKEIEEIIENSVYSAINEALNVKSLLTEMATFGVKKWGNKTYKIAVHGASTKDRPTPHLHIYLNDDVNPYTQFNIEVSLVDLLCNDRITPIYQHDADNNILRTNRKSCTWEGYRDIFNGLKAFFEEGPIKTKHGTFDNNLDRAIYEWNRETDLIKTENGGNPLKEYFDKRGIVPLPKYQKYLSDLQIAPSINTYQAGQYVSYHSFIINSLLQNEINKDNCIITNVIDVNNKQYQLFDLDSKQSFLAYDCEVEKTKELHKKDEFKIEYLVPKNWENN